VATGIGIAAARLGSGGCNINNIIAVAIMQNIFFVSAFIALPPSFVCTGRGVAAPFVFCVVDSFVR
jgi:hypothetical protein